MSRDLQDENYYISHAKKIPIKWTSPEVSFSYLNVFFISVITVKHIYYSAFSASNYLIDKYKP